MIYDYVRRVASSCVIRLADSDDFVHLEIYVDHSRDHWWNPPEFAGKYTNAETEPLFDPFSTLFGIFHPLQFNYSSKPSKTLEKKKKKILAKVLATEGSLFLRIHFGAISSRLSH